MKLGIDLDDVIAVCAVPYLRKFAQEFGVELPDEREIGWHLLASLDERVSPADRDRFRIKLYDGTFFADLDIYPECPAVLERMVEAGHDLFFVTARASGSAGWPGGARSRNISAYERADHLLFRASRRERGERGATFRRTDRQPAHRKGPQAGRSRGRRAREGAVRQGRLERPLAHAGYRRRHREPAGGAGRGRTRPA